MNAFPIGDDVNFQTLSSQAQNVYFNEPYIFEIVN